MQSRSAEHALGPSETVADLEDSPIIDVVRIGQEMEGIIPLWLGESDVTTDAAIMDAAEKSMRSGATFYTPNRGLPELRNAIAAYYSRIYDVDISDARICATNSGMHAVTMITRALMDQGDNAVLITPCWPNVDRAIRLVGGHVKEVPLDVCDGTFQLDLTKVEALCDARTKMIYLASPSNPTGWTISKEQSVELLELSRRKNVAILSDEVYQRLSFDSPNGTTLLSVANEDDALFVVNSFSKAWSMTGWRLGWMIYPKAFLASFEKLSQFTISGTPGFIQAAGVYALNHGDHIVAEMRNRCMVAKSYIEPRLSAISGITVIPSNGGFYSMFTAPKTQDSAEFCKGAARVAKIGLAPGSAFGKGGEGMIRICYARDKATLEEALSRLAHYVAS